MYRLVISVVNIDREETEKPREGRFVISDCFLYCEKKIVELAGSLSSFPSLCRPPFGRDGAKRGRSRTSNDLSAMVLGKPNLEGG
jgi:hypothetical protein